MSTQNKEDKKEMISFFVGILMGVFFGGIFAIAISFIRLAIERDHLCKSINERSFYDEKENTCVIKTVTIVKVKN
jgi:hypothetical protein